MEFIIHLNIIDLRRRIVIVLSVKSRYFQSNAHNSCLKRICYITVCISNAEDSAQIHDMWPVKGTNLRMAVFCLSNNSRKTTKPISK